MSQTHSYPNGRLETVERCVFELGEVVFYIAPSSDRPSDADNQDSLGVIELPDKSLVFAIADGAGAHRGGAEASRIAIDTLVQHLENSTDDIPWKAVIMDSIDQANLRIKDLGVGAATTFIVGHMNESGVRVFQIGDSGALIFGQRGKLKFQTLAHSPTGYAVEAGMIDEETALKHEDRNIISNFLGSPEMHMQIEHRVPFAAKDTLIMASDGLFDNLRTEEVIDLARKGSTIDVLEKMVHMTKERMYTDEQSADPSKADDLSIVLFRRRVSESPSP